MSSPSLAATLALATPHWYSYSWSSWSLSARSIFLTLACSMVRAACSCMSSSSFSSSAMRSLSSAIDNGANSAISSCSKPRSAAFHVSSFFVFFFCLVTFVLEVGGSFFVVRPPPPRKLRIIDFFFVAAFGGFSWSSSSSSSSSASGSSGSSGSSSSGPPKDLRAPLVVPAASRTTLRTRRMSSKSSLWRTVWPSKRPVAKSKAPERRSAATLCLASSALAEVRRFSRAETAASAATLESEPARSRFSSSRSTAESDATSSPFTVWNSSSSWAAWERTTLETARWRTPTSLAHSRAVSRSAGDASSAKTSHFAGPTPRAA
mmetsp:Transcript_17563/g.56992  ORF Transcript_17563/g.56992 Transcript_17563/m.56992 type:complete len:320 (-) Transcript_17563:1883-2842(-)